MFRILALLALLLAAPAAAQSIAAPTAAPAGRPIAIGTTHRLASKALGAEREINVRLPSSYAASPTRRYPVLYVLDGGASQDFPHIAGLAQHGEVSGTFDEYIVVGIATDRRAWELTTPTRDELYTTYMRANGQPAESATGGGSVAFRRFITEEAVPFVDANFRTSPSRTLMGESLAAFFVVDTLLRSPKTFTDYVAISPSLWWNREELPAAAPALLGANGRGGGFAGKRLYVTMASEGGTMRRGLDTLLAALRSPAARDLRWTHVDRRRSEHHGSIYHLAALDALRTLTPQPFRPGLPLPWLFVGDMPPLSPEAEADKKLPCTPERARPVTLDEIAVDPQRWEALCVLPTLGQAANPVERSPNWPR